MPQLGDVVALMKSARPLGRLRSSLASMKTRSFVISLSFETLRRVELYRLPCTACWIRLSIEPAIERNASTTAFPEWLADHTFWGNSGKFQ